MEIHGNGDIIKTDILRKWSASLGTLMKDQIVKNLAYIILGYATLTFIFGQDIRYFQLLIEITFLISIIGGNILTIHLNKRQRLSTFYSLDRKFMQVRINPLGIHILVEKNSLIQTTVINWTAIKKLYIKKDYLYIHSKQGSTGPYIIPLRYFNDTEASIMAQIQAIRLEGRS